MSGSSSGSWIRTVKLVVVVAVIIATAGLFIAPPVASPEIASTISLSFSVYPNPTIDFLILNVGNYKIQNLLFELYDINGKKLENKKLENNETTISMENIASGIYFLKVIESNNELKTFKIIKN